MVKNQLKIIENDHCAPVFARTGSSPFRLKWRGARSGTSWENGGTKAKKKKMGGGGGGGGPE
jgi:hypothetical protein